MTRKYSNTVIKPSRKKNYTMYPINTQVQYFPKSYFPKKILYPKTRLNEIKNWNTINKIELP